MKNRGLALSSVMRVRGAWKMTEMRVWLSGKTNVHKSPTDAAPQFLSKLTFFSDKNPLLSNFNSTDEKTVACLLSWFPNICPEISQDCLNL